MNFTKVDKQIIRNKEMNLKERAILILLLSYTENEKITIENISKYACISKDTCGKCINSLIDKGFVYRTRLKDKNGLYNEVKYLFSHDKDDLKQQIENF